MPNDFGSSFVPLLACALLAATFLAVCILAWQIGRLKKALTATESDDDPLLRRLEQLRNDLLAEIRASRLEQQQLLQSSLAAFSDSLNQQQQRLSAVQDTRLVELSSQLSQRQDTLQRTVNQQLQQMEERLLNFSGQSEARLEQIRVTMEQQLSSLRHENGVKLDEMRATVDEKLQKTLEERIGQSFRLVNERLEQVYKGLGEMQTLASGVGDLKKVLSNVKTRGILGEIQLGAILEQMLTPEQYLCNIATRPNSTQVVEFAIKLPGDERGTVLLPIDAKFPADTYSRLVDAYERGIPEEIEAAGQQLERAIKSFARDIHTKYVEPPHTTDFAIMFLPFEGLYAEVVRRGVMETLQREYRVSIAGPTTMAAILNSLQMGFRTLAIQKRSSEVWRVLGAVKTEFNKFGEVLTATQKRLEQANAELDKLVGVRTRQIQRNLSKVSELPDEEGAALLEEGELS